MSWMGWPMALLLMVLISRDESLLDDVSFFP